MRKGLFIGASQRGDATGGMTHGPLAQSSSYIRDLRSSAFSLLSRRLGSPLYLCVDVRAFSAARWDFCAKKKKKMSVFIVFLRGSSVVVLFHIYTYIYIELIVPSNFNSVNSPNKAKVF